jgi:hypothetical protein
MGFIEIKAFRCERCHHIWLPRNIKDRITGASAAIPKVCPSCKSPYWNTPRRKEKNNERGKY